MEIWRDTLSKWRSDARSSSSGNFWQVRPDNYLELPYIPSNDVWHEWLPWGPINLVVPRFHEEARRGHYQGQNISYKLTSVLPRTKPDSLLRSGQLPSQDLPNWRHNWQNRCKHFQLQAPEGDRCCRLLSIAVDEGPTLWSDIKRVPTKGTTIECLLSSISQGMRNSWVKNKTESLQEIAKPALALTNSQSGSLSIGKTKPNRNCDC